MGKTAMMGESEDRAAQVCKYIDVGSFRRERKRSRGERRPTIQPCATQAGASQEMSDGFQVVRRSCLTTES